jgi:hypothetical protein
VNDIEALVAEFGERYRKIISDAISFLDQKEFGMEVADTN